VQPDHSARLFRLSKDVTAHGDNSHMVQLLHLTAFPVETARAFSLRAGQGAQALSAQDTVAPSRPGPCCCFYTCCAV